jgi:hypothetical protein
MSQPRLKFALTDDSGANFYYWDAGSQTALTSGSDQFIDAPVNWRTAVKPKWARDTSYMGVFRSMNGALQFIGDGANIIRYLAATQQGIQTMTRIRMYLFNVSTLTYNLLYQSYLNYPTLEDHWQGNPQQGYVSIQLLDSKFYEILKAYENTEYNIAYGHYNSGTWVNDNDYAHIDGVKLYSKWDYATAADPLAGTPYEIDFNTSNNALIPLNYVTDVNTPVGNKIAQNLLLTNIQTFVVAGSDVNKPWGRFGGDGAYTSGNYFFKAVSPMTAEYFYAQIFTQLKLRIAQADYVGVTTYTSITCNIYEIDIKNQNQITIGSTNKDTTTGRQIVFEIRYYGKGTGLTGTDTIGDGSDGFAALTVGQDGFTQRTSGGNLWYSLIYPNASTAPLDKGGYVQINPDKVYVLSFSSVIVSSGVVTGFGFRSNSSSICKLDVGNTATGFQFSIMPPQGFLYPASPAPAMRMNEVGSLIVPIMASELGNVGFPQISLANQNIPYTFVSDFLSDGSASWNSNYNCKPHQLYMTSGSALRLNLSFAKVVDLSTIGVGNYNYEQAIITDDGTGSTVTLPVYGDFFSQNAPYASIQGAFFKTSLKEFFDSLNAILSMGAAIEPDNDGNDTIFRMENLKYFYDDTLFICDLGDVVDLHPSYMQDIMGNQLEVGYQNESYNQSYGTDEYNLNLTYKLLTPRVLKGIRWLSSYRADRYGIEFSRANTAANADTKFDSDNDKFIISLDETSGSYTYSDGTTLTAYPLKRWNSAGAGTQTYKNGLFYPDTTEYNLEISPKRNMLRHGDLLAAMNYKQDGSLLFRNYGINTKMGLNVQLNSSYPMLNEWGDVAMSDLPAPIFIPRIYKFKCSAPINLYSIMNSRDSSTGKMLRYGYVTFNWRGKQYKGYLWEAGINVGDNQLYEFSILPVYGQTNDIELCNIS